MIRLFLISLTALLLAGCGTVVQPHFNLLIAASVPTEAPVDEALYARGVEVYLAAYCGSCHALDAAGSWGAFGPAHNGMALIAEERLADPNYNGNAKTPIDYIRESILEPQIYYVSTYASSPHRMPAYTHLSEADVAAMVYMLMQQR